MFPDSENKPLHDLKEENILLVFFLKVLFKIVYFMSPPF